MKTEKPANGCINCESLFEQYVAIVDEYTIFLREYHVALREHNTAKIDEMRDRVSEYDLTRVLAREAWLSHQATHNGKKNLSTQMEAHYPPRPARP